MTREDLVLDAGVEDARSQYRFRTRDGVLSPDAFRPAELLLVEELWDRARGRLLVPEANYGVVGTVLADAAENVLMTESSARAAALCGENARRNDSSARVELLAYLSTLEAEPASSERAPRDGTPIADGFTPADAFHAVAYAPKPYAPLDLGQQRIADALSVLRPGGLCYVAAAPETGLSRYETCLETLAGEVETVSGRDGVSLLAAPRPGSFDPPDYVTPRTLSPTVDGVDLELVTVPGLFAAGRLDHGTRLLAETVDVFDGARVLDCPCGYGPLGVYAAAVADCEVWLTDDDRVATRCAECSLARTGVEGTVVTADCTAAVEDRTFDLVLCNPPTHAGADVLDDLFGGIRGVLPSDGTCALVHHRDLDLSAHLRGFGHVEEHRTGEEHVVLRATP